MKYKFNHCSTIFILVLALLVSACSSSKSPVSVRNTIDRATEAERLGGPVITIVQSGDTWYGIAFENNLNVAELAAWNGMSTTDTLFTGQRVRLTQPPGFQATQSRPQLLDPVITPDVPSSQSVIAQNSVVPNNSVISDNNARKGSVVILNPPTSAQKVEDTTPSQAPILPKPESQPLIANAPQNTTSFQQAVPTVLPKSVSWQWPIKGQVVSKYSPNSGRKGIDIAAKQGQEIKVAAPGRVVYQGNGIRGYNNLIIIKHTEELLSAYAHNQQVFVREGQWVNTGQTISTVGLKNGKPVLHFEIRKKGQPVNPLGYLGA